MMRFFKSFICLLALTTTFVASADEKLDSIMDAEFNRILISAIQGDAQSQYIVGYRYYHGRVVPRDLPKAVAFLSKAAGQDHMAARELLKQALYDVDNESIYDGDFEEADQEVIQSIYEYSKHKEKTYKKPDELPEFPGGVNALVKYLSTHIVYPDVSRQRGIEGKVIVLFVVTKSGSIGDIRVLESVDEELDQAAVQVCKSLPHFIPGRVDGKPVNVWFTLPVSFKLTD